MVQINTSTRGLHKHAACQLYGITLLVLPFYLAAGRNLYQRQYVAPGNIQNTFPDPLKNFYDRPSRLSSPRQPYFFAVLISSITLKAMWRICVDHIYLWAVAVRKSLPNHSIVF